MGLFNKKRINDEMRTEARHTASSTAVSDKSPLERAAPSDFGMWRCSTNIPVTPYIEALRDELHKCRRMMIDGGIDYELPSFVDDADLFFKQ